MTSQGLIRTIIQKPWICIGLITLLTIISIVLALQVQKNTTPYFIHKQHPERIKEDAMTEIFTRSKETIVILLNAKEAVDIFNEQSIALLEKIHEKIGEIDLIERLPRVENRLSNVSIDTRQSIKDALIKQYNQDIRTFNTAEQRKTFERHFGQFVYPIRSVKSLLNSDDVFEQDEDIVVAPSFSRENISLWAEGKGKTLLSNPLLLNALVDNQAKSLAVQVELNVDPDDSDSIKAIFTKIQQAVDAVLKGSDVNAFYSGTPVVNVEISNIMEKDNGRYFPIIVLLIALVLYILFRSVWASFLALSVSIISIIITFGLMTLLGITLNIVTTILPIFIITIGVTDAIHLLSKSKEDKLHETDVKETIFLKTTKLYRAMLLTSLTTALGFFSLSFTEIINIKDFGIMVGISTLIAWVIAVFVLPAVMSLVSYRAQSHESRIKLFESIENWALNQTKRRSLLIVICLLLIAFVGSFGFYVDQQNLNSFKPHTQVRQHDQVINSSLGGTIPLNIWLTSNQEKGAISSEVLALIERLEAKAISNEIVGYTVSVVGFLKHINKIMLPEDSEQKVSEFSPELIAQYLFLLEGGAYRDLESVLEVGKYQQTRLVIMAKTDGSADLQNLIDSLKQELTDLPNGVQAEFAGYANLNAIAAKEIVYGQINSILLSVIGLILLVAAIYRSLLVGVIAIFPLTMSLLVMFGLMGIFKIPLDIGSSLVCGVAFGIGIDYSIHIIEAYLRQLRSGLIPQEASKRAISEVSFPVLTSAFTISLGFSVLLISEFEPIFNLGLLVSSTMLISAFVTLFILPSVLAWIPRKVA